MTIERKGKFKEIGSKLENGVKRGLILAGQLVAQRAAQKAPRDTGRLKRSVACGNPYVTGQRRYAIDVGSGVSYAAAQEFGTGPYEIRPKLKRALAFEWPNAPAGMKPSQSGKYVFARVKHPGVGGQPFLRPALRESKREIYRIVLKSIMGALT